MQVSAFLLSHTVTQAGPRQPPTRFLCTLGTAFVEGRGNIFKL